MGIAPRLRSIASVTTLAFVVPSLILMGCGAADNLPREAISGSVAVDGKPLDSGLIIFQPEGTEATQSGASIVQGKYAIPRDQGLVPGKYKVSISAAGNTPEKQVDTISNNNMPGMPPVPAKEVIPSAYNSGSLLSAEVKAGSKNEFNFNLTSTQGK
jgi:hypothetical protein